ncbi:hypothetical protein B0T10DRAFT_596279 [Thelonectria olida]|uniref:FAD-containing monooxygenase EthA n=1 Tax=Thelonectria olida TaxID=1576542 RepID=A0A9P9AJB8_9HYPO|nr:hypothetical protein B0T10DRAFT_596279 [Thelonectria olida]
MVADTNDTPTVDFDLVIVGAGISGINTAFHIQTGAPQPTSYAIFEARSNIGGTWDLFQYPGVRSDSDIFTFSFPWNPWNRENILAPGSDIAAYVAESAAKFGIDKKIKFEHKVVSANWSSKHSLWAVDVQDSEGQMHSLHARFLVLGTGYYDYDEPLQAHIPGIENFKGTVIHPQFWPKGFDYTDKNVVVVGSGATAITIVPGMTEAAKHVTMLQRSPSYIGAVPQHDSVAELEKAVLPISLAWRVTRFRHMVFDYLFYYFCIFFPKFARSMILGETAKLLPPSVPIDPHFTPRYEPWTQRFCACPDGDFFAALRSGKASVITDTIKEVTQDAIQLHSGETLRPDVVITATGLKLLAVGGIRLSVNGHVVDCSKKFLWKGFMIQDLPNLALVLGYVNASWTLGAEITGKAIVRILRQIKREGASSVVPRLQHSERMQSRPFFQISSTYVRNVDQIMPKGGTGPWAHRWNYLADYWKSVWGDVKTGLEYR